MHYGHMRICQDPRTTIDETEASFDIASCAWPVKATQGAARVVYQHIQQQEGHVVWQAYQQILLQAMACEKDAQFLQVGEAAEVVDLAGLHRAA